VDEDRRAEAARRRRRRARAGVAEDDAVDVRADLDAAGRAAHQVLELGDGAVDVLQRHRAEAEEAAWLRATMPRSAR
jgi:hypothetical protein